MYSSDIHALQEERDRLTESLKLTVNHVARLERLIGLLSPEEQLVLDLMLINPYKQHRGRFSVLPRPGVPI